MKEITKSYLYNKLREINQSKNIDVSNLVVKTMLSDEVPYEVIVFVNKHSPIDMFVTYNEIYKKRRNSPLFRNIVSKDNTIEEKAIILSSLLTQSFIGIKHSKEDREAIANSINVDMIMEALNSYIYEGNTIKLEEAFDTFQVIFTTLFPKNRSDQ